MTEVDLTAKGARFRRSGDEAAVQSLLRILNDHTSVRRMQDAESIHAAPALAGVVKELEADPAIAPLLVKRNQDSLAFRQLVGIAVLIKMRETGWDKNDATKGRLGQSLYFTQSQRYVRVN